MNFICVTTYVLLFILKLRFPRNVPFTTTFINRYGTTVLSLYRKFEKFDFKVRKTQLDIQFLQKCKAHGITPKFLNFKVYNVRIKKTLTYKQFQFKLLNFELNEKNKLLKEQTTQLNNVKSEFKSKVSSMDYHCLTNRLVKSNDKKVNSAELIHHKNY